MSSLLAKVLLVIETCNTFTQLYPNCTVGQEYVYSIFHSRLFLGVQFVGGQHSVFHSILEANPTSQCLFSWRDRPVTIPSGGRHLLFIETRDSATDTKIYRTPISRSFETAYFRRWISMTPAFSDGRCAQMHFIARLPVY